EPGSVPKTEIMTPDGGGEPPPTKSASEAGGFLLLVALHGQFDQPVNELSVGDAGVFPHLRIHADGSEAGDGVDLVDVEFAGRFFAEEIDAAHSFAAYGAEAFDREAAHLGNLGRRHVRG